MIRRLAALASLVLGAVALVLRAALAVVDFPRGVVVDQAEARTWSTPSSEVDAHAAVPAGVDGEPLALAPPLRFSIRRAALRCRIARRHPGATSPSKRSIRDAGVLGWQALRPLPTRIAGRAPRSIAAPPRAGPTP